MDILDYNKITFKDVKLAKLWLYIMIFIITGILILFNNTSYKEYYRNNGILIDKDMLKMEVYNDDLNNILDNNKIIINNRSFAYRVIEILDTDSIYTKTIILKINIDNSYNIKNNIFSIKILVEEKTILKYIYKKIGGT